VFVSGEIHEVVFYVLRYTNVFIKDSGLFFLLITTFCELVDVYFLPFQIFFLFP
jgi:hypothetical protein